MSEAKLRKILNTAKPIAKAKCCFCGVNAFIAESAQTVGHHGQAVMHAEPFCEQFLACDPDEFIKRCDFNAIDPLVEAFAGLLDEDD